MIGTSRAVLQAQSATDPPEALEYSATAQSSMATADEIALRANGRVRWTHRRGAWSYSSAAVTPDCIAWFGDHRGYLSGVSVRSGLLVTRHRGVGRPQRSHRSVGIWTTPTIDRNGEVHFGTRPGPVYGFAPDGRRIFDVDTGASVDSYPAIGADGTLDTGASVRPTAPSAPSGAEPELVHLQSSVCRRTVVSATPRRSRCEGSAATSTSSARSTPTRSWIQMRTGKACGRSPTRE